MQQPTTDEGRWELGLYQKLVVRTEAVVAKGRARLGLPAGYAGEEPLLASAPHWAGRRPGWRASARAVLGERRLGFGQYAYVVRSAVAEQERGVLDARSAAVVLLGTADWPMKYRLDVVAKLVRELAAKARPPERRRWVVGMLKEAALGWRLVELRRIVAAQELAVVTPEWQELEAFCRAAVAV